MKVVYVHVCACMCTFISPSTDVHVCNMSNRKTEKYRNICVCHIQITVQFETIEVVEEIEKAEEGESIYIYSAILKERNKQRSPIIYGVRITHSYQLNIYRTYSYV